jgi:hypothetical protein
LHKNLYQSAVWSYLFSAWRVVLAPDKRIMKIDENTNAQSIESPDIIDAVFSPSDKRLYALLNKLDESGRLSKMLYGVVTVLSNPMNPMRFQQAAATIRLIADSLIKTEQAERPRLYYLSAEESKSLDCTFEEVLGKTTAKVKNAKEQEELTDQAKRKYQQLKDVLLSGTRTKKDLLRDLLWEKRSEVVPEIIRNTVNTLMNVHSYFDDVIHGKGDESRLIENWEYFKEFLILVASDFNDIAEEIDSIIADKGVLDG